MFEPPFGDHVTLYGAALEHMLYPAWEWLRGRPTFEMLAFLRRMERASLDERAALRSVLLRRLVRHAYEHTSHYRDVLDGGGLLPADVTDVDDIARLPVLDRATAKRTVDRRTARWPRVAVTKATSGSTGEPLEVRFSAESRLWRDATRWRGFGWGGYRMGMKALHVWGVPATPPTGLRGAKLELDRRLRRDVYVSCMVRSDEALRRMVETIQRERPQAILGYAQAIADLARHVNRHGLRDWDTIPVIYGAERLWPHDRSDLERAFGPAVFETYGCREFMLIGAECEVHDGLHESAENLIVEILVEEGGRWRAARSGEMGQVAITDLHNLTCPMIRYLTGDRAMARAPIACGCGRTLPRFGPVDGRVTETLRDAAGNPVEGILFNILFLELAGCTRQFQAVQRTDGSVLLNVVPEHGDALPAAATTKIRAFVAEHLRGVPLEIRVVAEIPLTRAGKLQRVVVERATG